MLHVKRIHFNPTMVCDGLLWHANIELSDGDEATITTCSCGRGCFGTTPLPLIGMRFADKKDFTDWAKRFEAE